MNIQEAAKLIDAGKIVRRKSWEFYDGPWDGLRKSGNGALSLLGRVGLDDLLANDWEVVDD